MLFRFLRQYLKDDEFDRTEVELAETKAVLKEYKDFIEQQKRQDKDEKEKVDSDFLVLVWATVGFGIYIFSSSAPEFIKLQNTKQFTLPLFIWLAFSIVSLVFAILNGWIALQLTEKYANSKSDPLYKLYALLVIAGATILVIGTVFFMYIQ